MGRIGGRYLAETSKMLPKMLYWMNFPPWLSVAWMLLSIPGTAAAGCCGGWAGSAPTSAISASGSPPPASIQKKIEVETLEREDRGEGLQLCAFSLHSFLFFFFYYYDLPFFSFFNLLSCFVCRRWSWEIISPEVTELLRLYLDRQICFGTNIKAGNSFHLGTDWPWFWSDGPYLNRNIMLPQWICTRWTGALDFLQMEMQENLLSFSSQRLRRSIFG